MPRPKPPRCDLYILQAHTTGAFKVGRTNNVKRRIDELQTGCPYRIKLLILLEYQGHQEKKIHRRLASHRTHGGEGEWFHYEGLSDLPDEIYELLDIEMMDSWWVLNP